MKKEWFPWILRNAAPRDKHHPLLIHFQIFQAQDNHSLQLQSRCDLQHFGCILRALFEYLGIRIRPWRKHSFGGLYRISFFFTLLTGKDLCRILVERVHQHPRLALKSSGHHPLWYSLVSARQNLLQYKIPKLMLFTQRTCKSQYASPKLVLVLKQFARYEKCVQNNTNACKGSCESCMKPHDSRCKLICKKLWSSRALALWCFQMIVDGM